MHGSRNGYLKNGHLRDSRKILESVVPNAFERLTSAFMLLYVFTSVCVGIATCILRTRAGTELYLTASKHG